MVYEVKNNEILFKGVRCLDISLSSDCGHAFRWSIKADGKIHGTVENKSVDIIQTENEIIFLNTTEEEFKSLWWAYFDFERDYEGILDSFDDEHL